MPDKKCSKCGKPCKGHDGPYGPECKYETLNEIPLQVEEEGAMALDENRKNSAPMTNSDMSTSLLQQLVTQMTALNVNILAVAQGQQDIKNIVSQQTLQNHSRQTQNEAENPSGAHVHQPERTGTSTDQVENGSILEELNSATTILSNGCKVTDRAVKSVRRGEFVNMTDLLPVGDIPLSGEIEPTIDNSGKLVFKAKKSSRCIDTFSQWLSAWNNYECLLIEINPSKYAEYARYRSFIQSCDTKFMWPAVYAYDCRFRAKS